MVDTPRTLSAILALLADNATGAISAQDLRDFAVSVPFYEAGDDFHTEHWIEMESENASSGDTLKATGRLQMRSHYWSGADAYLDGRLYSQTLSDGASGYVTRLVWESETDEVDARSVFHVVTFERAGGANGAIEFDSMRTVHDDGGGIAVRGGLEFYSYNESVAALSGSPSSIGNGATIGLKNDARIRWRNAAGNADIDGIYVDSSNRVHFGATAYVQGDDLVIGNSGGRLTVGSAAASAGAIRLENQAWIAGRNAANSGDVNMWRISSADVIIAGAVLNMNNQNITGVAALLSTGTNATAGLIRTPNNWPIIKSRNAANNANVDVLTITSADYVSIGNGLILLPSLPTANPSVAGALWNDSGVVKVSAG